VPKHMIAWLIYWEAVDDNRMPRTLINLETRLTDRQATMCWQCCLNSKLWEQQPWYLPNTLVVLKVHS